jgi:hypothetical protein
LQGNFLCASEYVLFHFLSNLRGTVPQLRRLREVKELTEEHCWLGVEQGFKPSSV